jgi:nitroreductase
MLGKIAEGLPNGQMLNDAGLGIIISADMNVAHDGLLSYALQDCSAAIQNILLAASILGLGACWLGVHPREERIEHIRRVASLPENILPVSVVSIGWPAEVLLARTRYDAEKISCL